MITIPDPADPDPADPDPMARPSLPGGRLTRAGGPRRPESVVLVLPGGKATSARAARAWHLANVRMRGVAGTVRRVCPASAVYRLRYRERGWNHPACPPVTDAREALAVLTARYPRLPMVLVGHSMGGRVAVALAAHPAVVGVVALAPWWPDGDADRIPAGTGLVVIHGTQDRWTDPAASRRSVHRARERGAAATYRPLEGAGHFMLTDRRRWAGEIGSALRQVLPTSGPAAEARTDR